VFSELPSLTTEQSKLEKLRSINNFFTGEYDTVLFEASGEPELIDADLGVYIHPKPITELERLSYVVAQIRKLHCLPKNRLKLTPTGERVMNESFRGLSKEDAFKLENW
jgi:hypothetical protein